MNPGPQIATEKIKVLNEDVQEKNEKQNDDSQNEKQNDSSQNLQIKDEQQNSESKSLNTNSSEENELKRGNIFLFSTFHFDSTFNKVKKSKHYQKTVRHPHGKQMRMVIGNVCRQVLLINNAL